jgi:hypothetical protein
MIAVYYNVRPRDVNREAGLASLDPMSMIESMITMLPRRHGNFAVKHVVIREYGVYSTSASLVAIYVEATEC